MSNATQNGKLKIDSQKVSQAASLICEGGVTEVRALEASVNGDSWPKNYSGYFDNPTALAEAVSTIRSAKGIYFVPNALNSALLSRAANRLVKAGKGSATQDSDIVRRRWLLIDCDAQRPAGISSTDLEHEAAIEKCRTIFQYLRDEGWPDPVAADSGNGGHLLYRVELPSKDSGLVERCLKALALQFDDQKVHVDTTVHNPARIWKLYGTPACKGDSTPSRPHRMSKVLSVPETIEIVSCELIDALAGKAPPPEQRAPSRSGHVFDIESFFQRHGLDVTEPHHSSDKTVWNFNTSPMCDHHGGGPHLIQFANGALSAGCLHNSCSWTWADLRAKFEHKNTPCADTNGANRGKSPLCQRREEENSPHCYARTDMGNAERFAVQHGGDIRFLHSWGKWLIWNGRYWQLDDSGEIVRRAKLTAKSIYHEAAEETDKKESDLLASWAKSSQASTRLEAMLKLARSERPIPISYKQLDAKPWLLNCENGTLNLRSGVLRQHDRGDLLTKTTGIDYPDEPGADSPMWIEFLDTVFDNDTSLIRFMQRLLGSALPGVQLEHIVAIAFGGGSNGKSVFTATVQKALGDYAMTAPAGLLMSRRNEQHPTELADLFGKRLVVISETKDGQRLDEGLVKSVTGGDQIRARRMREDHWEFAPSHLPIVVTNHKPIVRGTDYGIWRRLRLIPFTVTIPPQKQNKELPTQLEVELPAILRWMVEGCLEWQRHGLDEPESVLAATEAYKTESDNFSRWFEEVMVRSPDEECQANQVYGSYKRWCEEGGERPLNQTQFGGRMNEVISGKRKSNGILYIGVQFQSS